MNPMAAHQRCCWPRLAGGALVLLVAACGGGGGGAPAPQVNQNPVARFSSSVTDGVVPLAVSFDASASSDADGNVTTFSWDFGDDAMATGANVSHTFSDPGSFTVTLEVTDDDGSLGITSRSIRVRGGTVSGVIQIGAGSSVDSDVNDSFTVPVANNDFGGAQAVGNPLTLGGFANVAGSGSESGNFFLSGDPDDFYFVELEGDERIVLSIGDPSTADLDLELYSDEATPQVLDASVSTEATEDLAAPAGGGSFFVRVFAVSGASNYVLSISDDVDMATMVRRRAKRLSDPFVAGEVLLAHPGDGIVQRYRVPRGGRSLARFSDAGPTGGGAVPAPPAVRLPAMRLPAGAAIDPAMELRYRTLLAVRAAGASPGVALAEPNVLRQPLLEPDDEFYDLQWHYPGIALDQAWDLTTGRDTGNPDVVVAVVDTGVLLDHPDLNDSLLRDAGLVVGYDFIQDPARANDGDGLDPDPNDAGDLPPNAPPGAQPSYHGTHVAGTVAAETDNGVGVAGVSWGARLMPLRVLGIDGGTTFDVMQAVRYAARLSNNSGTIPPVRADIVNLSLGSDFFSQAEQQTIEQVRAQGVIVVASAGNNASSVPSYPAAYDGVISVSASAIDSDASGQPAPYSNFGPEVDIAAPGGWAGDDGGRDVDANGRPDGVVSTLGERNAGQVEFGYAILQGTSMSAPHVSGVVALMKSIYPGLTPAELDGLLQDGQLTDDAGLPGRDDRFGMGIINALKAVEAANRAQGGAQITFIQVSEGRLNFQSFTQSLSFEITRVGDDPVLVTVTDDAPWLTVVPEAVGVDGLGSYTATVDRTGLADDTYAASISIDAGNPDVSDRTVRVTMRVTSPDPDANAGQHFVILVPPDETESTVAAVVSAANGAYVFSLEDVPPGDYGLFAGTDLDDDGFVCDGGEACGAFPSLSSPALITVAPRSQPVIDGLSFMSEFRTTATTTTSGGDGLVTAPDAGIALPPGARNGAQAQPQAPPPAEGPPWHHVSP